MGKDESSVLIRILRTYLRPFTTLLLAVVGLQLVSSLANLYLPSLNADIIDKGVAKGDHLGIKRKRFQIISRQ